jgi:2,3-bisphosphoglycerate-independent phosphoglycerate mutase
MRQMFVMVVLDGWGIGAEDQTNPVHVVNPQTFSWLRENFPMTSLQASGISVGLPWGETGNSEVGHLTLGAGTVIYQFFPKITMAIEDETFYQNEALKGAFAHARKNGSVVHLMGLLTGASTHAALSHLEALIKMGERENVPVQMDLFADGKDSPPFTIEGLLAFLPKDRIEHKLDSTTLFIKTNRCCWNIKG